MDREIQDVQPRLVKLIDHEPDDSIVTLGDHADAISLTQRPHEVVVVPRELETLLFDFQDLGHVSPNHPANMNPQLPLFLESHSHLRAALSRMNSFRSLSSEIDVNNLNDIVDPVANPSPCRPGSHLSDSPRK